MSIETDTEQLWPLLKDILIYYDNLACQCAFPRFRQIVNIDCTDTSDSFYVRETEGLIEHGKNYFLKEDIEPGGENLRQIWACKKCRSTFEFGWCDFSIYVNRCYLKAIKLEIKDIGKSPQYPIPLFVGAFGHSIPQKSFVRVDIDAFKEYLEAV